MFSILSSNIPIDSSLHRALVLVEDDARSAIIDTLCEWAGAGASFSTSAANRAIENLRRESFLDEESLCTILQTLQENRTLLRDGQIELFEQKLLEECRNHLLKGGRVQVSLSPVFLGHAIDQEKIKRSLLKNNGIYFNNDIRKVETFLERLSGARSIPSPYVNLRVRKYNMWATWSKTSHNPFDFMQTSSANEVRLCLALDPRSAMEPLYILTYRKSFDLYRPTVADAGFNRYFKATPPSEGNHGLTDPFNNNLRREYEPYLPTRYACVERPECLHKPITFNSLLASNNGHLRLLFN